MLGKIVIDGKDTKMENPNLRNLVAEVSIAKPRIWLPQKIVGGSRGRVPDNAQLTNWNQFKASSHKSASTGGRESTDRTREYSLKIGLLNCGAKKNIIRSLLKRGVTVYELPWNFDPFGSNKDLKRGVAPEEGFPSARSSTQQTTINSRTRSEHRRGGNWRQDPEFEIPKLDGLVISNGPGDPKMAKETIQIIKKSMDRKLPTFGICLGNQLLALAAGGDTYKLKFGHRAQNQPTIEVKSGRCYITTQNHGFAVSEKKLPAGFARWFYNANDNTNEGIIHKSLPFFSIQFHPEAAPGPTDTEFLFDYFLERITKHK
ncbi:gamma-glutamyl-gamma-aminobutyrate hydrolase family protein [Candidatus Curtissbacteria bacterium]|nr:gamma-glutamyl-gamma-aminobutyrate hydrolase family protein [Candidatus Curtissbacteria bacterium]